jgi:DNA mismatch repair protein MSH6
MEETKSILTYGTHRSLAIIDELGRGTSTFDGMAIAYSVLLDLIERVQCRCLFATHYHSLSKQFESVSAVGLKMMDYIVAEDKIIFLYKLKEGRTEQSFALNVAKVVKIPQAILDNAEIQSKKMAEEINRKDKNKKIREAIALALS